MEKPSLSAESPCPCSAEHSFGQCCGPILNGDTSATTAEQLMRSRYSEYATFNLEYVKNTWHPRTLPPKLKLVPEQVWIGLKIKRIEDGGSHDATGIVEFVAKSKRNGRARKMHEVSNFEKVDGRWLYVSGDYSADSDPS